MDEINFKPKKVTNLNDRLDEDGVLCIRGLLKHTQAIAHKVESHDKTPNVDGNIELIDDEDRPVGELTIQAKTYKSKYQGRIKLIFLPISLHMRQGCEIKFVYSSLLMQMRIKSFGSIFLMTILENSKRGEIMLYMGINLL